jgi:predicted flap endonuclease-1-like 5' DNA nuclease
MTPLFHIVRAAHATGTHHKLALDALQHLDCMDGDIWPHIFLVHAKLYLEGAKAPDTEFKDFKNHVLHTRDGYWGGAPEKVRSWYNHLVEALAQEDWPTAVYCAGVLSHYYTDPLHPFHTGQSEAENNIHRAVEWSISKSYDQLAALGEREFRTIEVKLPPGPNWLAELVCQGAEKANGYYEKLIAHYDMGRGVVDPPAGLDPVAQRLVAELIRYAVLSFAAVLERAIEESNTHAPEVPLAAATLSAVAQVPFKLIARRIADAQERRLVERMYDELLATGTVETHLAEDDRAVRDLHAAEVLARRPPQPHVSKVFPFKPRAEVVTSIARQRAAAGGGGNVVAFPTAASEPAGPGEAARQPRPTTGLIERLASVTAAPPRRRKAEAAAQPAAPVPPAGERQYHLSLDSSVVDGPSIGPKTAERLHPHGIATIRDLLKVEPAALAVLLDSRQVTAETVVDWQDQARLVCTVPGLRGTHAQLLVGAGYRTAEAVAAAEADKLCADVLAFAASARGQRVLRNGDPPDIARIKGWLEAAQSVKAA